MSRHNQTRGDYLMSTTDHGNVMIAKATPAIVGTGFSFSSVPWADVAACLTCIYVAFQIGDWVWKKWRAYQAWRETE